MIMMIIITSYYNYNRHEGHVLPGHRGRRERRRGLPGERQREDEGQRYSGGDHLSFETI